MSPSDDAETLRQRTASLRRAWEMLQIIRKIVETSQGEPLPLSEEKSITKEGMRIAEHLGKHLAKLHRDLVFCQQTVDLVWKFKEGADLRVSIHGDRGKVARMELKTDQEISHLAGLAHTLAEEIEKRTGETLYRRYTVADMEQEDRMLKEQIRLTIQRVARRRRE